MIGVTGSELVNAEGELISLNARPLKELEKCTSER